MKTIQINDEDYDFLADLINELKTQDNLGTRDPIYLVRQTVQEARPDDDKYGSDGTMYVERLSGNNNVFYDKIAMYRDLLECGYSKNQIRDDGYDEINYTNEDHIVTSALTRKGAQRFINRKQHDYKPLHVYVGSMCHNYEMIRLRNLLLNLTLE